MADDLSDFQPVAAATPAHDVSDFEPVSSPATARSPASTSDLSDFEPAAPYKVVDPKNAATMFSGMPVEAGPHKFTGENQYGALFTPPEITPKDIERVSPILSTVNPLFGVTHGLIPRTTNVAASGAANVVSGFANMLNSDEGLLMLGTGGLPKAAQSAVGLAFAAHAIKDSPEAVSEFVSAKTDEDRSKALTRILNNFAIGAGGIAHGFGRPVPETPGVEQPPAPTGKHAEIVNTARDELRRAADETTKEVEPVLPKFPGDTQDKVRAIIAKQASGTELSPDERATLIQVQSFAAQTARDQTAEQFTSPTALPPTSAPAAEAAGDTLSGSQGGSPPARSSLFAQAKQEAATSAVAPLVQSAEAASDVVPAAAEAAKQAAAVIADKASSPTAEVEPPASGQAGTPTEAAEGRPSEVASPATGAAGVKLEPPAPLVGPALIQDGAIVAQGPVGKVHDDLVAEGAEQNKDLTDATRGFHDANGQPLSRTEAAQRALDTGAIDKPTFDKVMAREPAENKGLHSEDLIAAKEEAAPALETDTRKFKPEAIPDVLKELEEEKPAAPAEPKTAEPAPIDKDEAAKATRGIPGALGDAVRDVLLNDKSVQEAAADNGTTAGKVQDSVNRMRQYLSDRAARAAAEEPKTEAAAEEPTAPKLRVSEDDPRVLAGIEEESRVKFARNAVDRAEVKAQEQEKKAAEAEAYLKEIGDQSHLRGNARHEARSNRALADAYRKDVEKAQQALDEARKWKASFVRQRIQAEVDAAPEAPPEPAAPKEPWQRTRDEVSTAGDGLAAHRLAVRKAVGEGQAVPLEVLEDFKGSPWADKAREKLYGQQISDTLLGKILKGLTDEGNTLYSDPLFINSVGKPVLRAAVKILQEGIEGGKLAGDAITDALGYLREHIPNLNEDKANEFFDQFFEKPEEATPPAAESVSPESPAPEHAIPGDRAAAEETAPSSASVDPRATTEEGQRYTSTKNTVVDAERKARGEPELMSEAAKSLGATWDEASRQVDLNREAGPNLVKELNGKPRTIGAVEEAILLHHKIDVMNDLSKNTEVALDANADAGDRAEARMTAARLMDQLNNIDEATRKAGTEWGRTGRFRQVLAAEDYSLAKMLQRSELAKGRELTDEEKVKVQQMSTRIADLEKKLAEHEQQADVRREQTKNADVDKVIEEMKKPATEADKYSQGILDRIRQGLQSQEDKAWERIRARLGKASAGVDPTVIYDVAVIGANRLFKTGLDFAKWSSEMAKTFADTLGDTITPHLQEIFDQSKKINEDAIDKTAPKELRAKLKTKPADDAEARTQIVQTIANRSKAKESLGGQIKKLAENFVRNGITEREALVTAVHDAVKEALPEATRRDIRDSISGYGEYRELSQDEVQVKMRDLKGQMQQISKIEDLTGKGPTGKPKLPDPTGAQRRTKTAEERVLEQEVNRIKKESGLEQTDPKSLKGAMDAVKARLKNRIEDIQLAISKKEKLPAKGKALPDDPEVAQLRRDKDALQKEYDAMLGVDTPGKESTKETALTKSIDDLKKQIETGEIEKAKEATADTQRVAELKAQRDELLQKKEDIRRAKNPPKTEDERKVDALEKRATELRKKINAGDIEPKTGKPTVDITEVAAAKAEVERLNDQIAEMRKTAHPPKSEEARRLESLEKRVEEAKVKIAAGDLAGKPKRATVDTQEIAQAKSELVALNKQLSEMRKAANPPRTPEEIRERALDKRIEDLEKKIAAGDISTKTGKPTVDTAEIAARKVKLEALNKELADLREAANPKLTPEQIALKVYKTRTAKRIADLQDRLARKDFSTKPRKLVPLDTEGFKLKTDAERAKLEFDREKYKDEQKSRDTWEKIIDYVPKVSRATLLSSPLTLAKLTAAALWRMSITPLEELIGGGLGKLPFISDIAARAPREGGFNAKAEARALTDAVTLGMKDAYQKLFRGDTDLDVTGQKRSIIPHELIDVFGNIHGALKAPVVRAEFARSFEKRAQFAIANGIDVTDPMVLTRLQVESYKDAQRAIFMQDNRVVSAWSSAMKQFGLPSKVTGRPTIGGKVAQAVGKTLLPIVKIPTNIVAEAFQYATGAVTGSARLANAFRRGVETLKPEENDLIMRELKKGLFGNALLLLGFFAPQVIGGYYQQGQKRKEGDVKPGGARLYGVNIPPMLLHNPALEIPQMGSTIRRVADSKLRKKDRGVQGIPAGVLAAGLGLIQEVPFVNETTQISKVFNPQERTQFFGELARSRTEPQVMQWLASQGDKRGANMPEALLPWKGEVRQRKPENFKDEMKMGIPGLRKTVPLKKKQLSIPR